MSELADTLGVLEGALRDIGEEGRAEWIAERRARADREPEAVSAEVRRVIAGMGGLADLRLEPGLIDRVRLATGDEIEDPRDVVHVRPGGPIRP